MKVDLILGTAGHIDHGKTSLIRALTGVDTDRLPEERQRGITIELGFAELDLGELRLGIVDVPGHERFVRNMLAGATGMDIAMLVVAADDSVKQQTREHLDVLRLLELPAGVIALTKSDVADSEWMELVEEEVRDLVKGCFLADAPIIRTSVTTGEGVDALRSALSQAGKTAITSQRMDRAHAPFRMAIDRAFTIAGHGTVVTGSVSSGKAAVGDRLVIQPGSVEVRVRGVQNHDRVVDEVHRGQRAAVNLAGVRHDEIRRGQELSGPGHLVPSRLLTVQLTLLPTAPRPVKNRTRLRLHVGTAEVIVSVLLLGRDRLAPGETAWAQLLLGAEAVTTWNQPFVVRSESPVVTVGGGHVLVPNALRIRRPASRDLEQLERLTSPDALARASAALYFAPDAHWQPQDLARTAGITEVSDIQKRLIDSGELEQIAVSPQKALSVSRLVLEGLSQQVESALEKAHQREPLLSLLDRARFASRLRFIKDSALVDAVLADLETRGRIRLTDRGIGLADYEPRLSASEQKLLKQLVQQYRQAGCQPPTVKECIKQAVRNREAVESLISLATTQGDLVRVNPEILLHSEVEAEMRRRLADHLNENDGLTVSQIREILDTTRKYAVPFCEYLDRVGFTQRRGDLRILADPNGSLE